MVVRGHISRGAVILDKPVAVPDGTPVEVTVLGAAVIDPSEDDVPTLYERMKSFLGTAESLPEDAASQVDHYLYGLPKR